MNGVELIHNGGWGEKRPDWCFIRNIGVVRLKNGAYTENHFHDANEYYIICTGEADLVLNSQRFRVRAGDVAAIRCGARHHLEKAESGFCCVTLREDLQGQRRDGAIPDPGVRRFIGVQGRYEDGPVLEDEIPEDDCAVVNARTWFWLKQRPSWTKITSLGSIVFPDHGEEADYHKHECDEIYICVSGRLDTMVGDQNFEMLPGDIITIPIGTNHRVTCAHGESVLTYFYGELRGLRRYGHLQDGRDDWVLPTSAAATHRERE
jgi:mannose-6-phosphate isomerase-like protein (cupin superfamily)